MRPLGAGERVGRFEIVRLLGQGGTGAVYEARSDGETVALKLLLPGFAADDGLVARARREGRALAALDHPGIVRVVEAGEVSGEPFLALELLPGGTLADRERTPWADAFRIGARIARALAAVHAAGLVHRDVKPGNIFLDAHGQPKLGDFGFVKPADGKSVGITLSGETIGTPAFLAPEQIDTAKKVGPAADLYALGATLFALVTGKRPFAGVSGPQLLYAKLTREPPDPGEAVALPKGARRLIRRLLARDPAARGKDAATVASELDAIATSSSRRTPALVLAGVMGVAVIAALALASRGRDAVPPAPPVQRPPVAPVVTARSKPPRAEVPAKYMEEIKAAKTTSMGPAEQDARLLEIGDRLRRDLPKVGMGWALCGASLYRHNERGKLLPEAIADLEKATKLDDTDAQSWYYLAKARRELLPHIEGAERNETASRALAAADRAVELDPENALAWRVRGEFRLNAHSPDDGIADLAKAAQLAIEHEAQTVEPDRDRHLLGHDEVVSCWSQYATVLVDYHEYERALEATTTILERIEKKSPGALHTRARARLGLGDFPRATDDLLEALKLTTGDAPAGAHLVLVMIAEGALEKGDAATARRALASLPKDLEPELAPRARAVRDSLR